MSSLDRRGSHIAVHGTSSASAVGTREVDASLRAGVVLVAVVFGTSVEGNMSSSPEIVVLEDVRFRSLFSFYSKIKRTHSCHILR